MRMSFSGVCAHIRAHVCKKQCRFQQFVGWRRLPNLCPVEPMRKWRILFSSLIEAEWKSHLAMYFWTPTIERGRDVYNRSFSWGVVSFLVTHSHSLRIIHSPSLLPALNTHTSITSNAEHLVQHQCYTAKMQFTAFLSVALFAVITYARTDCTADANYCGCNLISKGRFPAS